MEHFLDWAKEQAIGDFHEWNGWGWISFGNDEEKKLKEKARLFMFCTQLISQDNTIPSVGR